MNIQSHKKLSLLRFSFALYLLITYLPVITSCQSRELSRAQAQKMITADNNFQQIITLDYMNRTLKENGHGTGDAKSSDEPETESIQTRVNEYYYEEPRVQIANYLGFVEPKITRTAFQPARSSLTKQPGFWIFDEKWVNTVQGTKLWSNFNLSPQETTVPLARREFLKIIGMTKIDESQMGADFIWQWQPNELGKVLDPTTQEFKAMPDAMQKNLLLKRDFIKERLTYSWSGDRSGQALFRHYDDGWRLEWLKF